MPLHSASTTVKRTGAKPVAAYTLAPAPARIPKIPRLFQQDGFLARSNMPPGHVRLATVALRGGRKNSRQFKKPVYVHPEEFKEEEIDVSLEKCMQTRPPMQLDMTGPNPTTYDQPKVYTWETKSPAYTMRPKTEPEKDFGGDRVSWSKQWFANPHIWTLRTKFDLREPWPSPATYKAIPSMGSPQAILPQSPSHSIAIRKEFLLHKKGSESEPAPNQYNYDKSKQKILTRFPSYTIRQGRRGGTAVWSAKEPVPGPGSYNPKSYVSSQKKLSPAYSWSRSARTIGITQNCTF